MPLRHDSSALRHATSATEFGRVAVLCGGSSRERELSLHSGEAVLAALLRRGVDAQRFDPAQRPLSTLPTLGVERVWNALHGTDGTLQGALEYLGIAYTGSGVLGSAIGMDRLRTKRLAQSIGVPTADYVVVDELIDLDAAVARLGLPLVVKPALRSSNGGMARVEHAEQLRPALEAALRVAPLVFAEAGIAGGEYSVAVLQGVALPSIRVENAHLHCPSGLSAQAEDHLARLALASLAVCGAEGWGQVDFRMDRTGRPQLLEISTVPDMTDDSLVPQAARTAGIDFDTLVWRVLETSFTRVATLDRIATQPPTRLAC